MMYEISLHLGGHDCYFSPFFADPFLQKMANAGLLDFCSLGGPAKRNTVNYLHDHNCKIDNEGQRNNYDLVITCSDLLIPKSITDIPIVHVQEGMTDPEDIRYHLVKTLKLPRFLANTSMMGLSNAYVKFCVMGEGWKDIFIKKGVDPKKIAVTGLPNFDNVESLKNNDFPHKNYVLAITSALRETIKPENRIKFIKDVVSIAGDRKIIFKLHPIEKKSRAIREIKRYAPHAKIYTSGNTDHMVANCDVMVTRYSTVVLVAIALGKKVYSDFTEEELKQRVPLQNGGKSGKNIADICLKYL